MGDPNKIQVEVDSHHHLPADTPRHTLLCLHSAHRPRCVLADRRAVPVGVVNTTLVTMMQGSSPNNGRATDDALPVVAPSRAVLEQDAAAATAAAAAALRKQRMCKAACWVVVTVAVLSSVVVIVAELREHPSTIVVPEVRGCTHCCLLLTVSRASCVVPLATVAAILCVLLSERCPSAGRGRPHTIHGHSCEGARQQREMVADWQSGVHCGWPKDPSHSGEQPWVLHVHGRGAYIAPRHGVLVASVGRL